MWLLEHKATYSFSNLKCGCNYNLIHRRYYYEVRNGQLKESLIAVVIYPGAYLNKSNILKYSKKKAEVYRWVNKVKGNTYIGSCINLIRRFRVYYDFFYVSFRINKIKSRIYSANLKHGYSNFQLEI